MPGIANKKLQAFKNCVSWCAYTFSFQFRNWVFSVAADWEKLLKIAFLQEVVIGARWKKIGLIENWMRFFRRWQKMVKLKGNQDIWWAGFWNQSNARIDLSHFEKLTCLERITLLQIIHSLSKPGNFVQRIAYRCVLLVIFKQNYAPKLFTAFKAAHSYWFS